ncbi:MAG: NADH-quinone oxidoreductase subunit J [Acidobacteriaceae bacterium]
MHLALFIIFGGLCVAGALNLLLQRHPINSALSLIVVMSSLAVLYLLLGAEFLAAAQVIVYSGAIMVLFTFVIMLLNAGKEERTHGSRLAYIAGFPGAAALLGLLAFMFLSHRSEFARARIGEYVVTTGELSSVLFTKLLLPFEVTSVLIFVAILGAVALARKEH